MSSAALAVTLTQTIPLWIGVKKGLSIEKVLEGLPKDSENRSSLPKRSVYGRTSKGSSAKALFGSYLACACR